MMNEADTVKNLDECNRVLEDLLDDIDEQIRRLTLENLAANAMLKKIKKRKAERAKKQSTVNPSLQELPTESEAKENNFKYSCCTQSFMDSDWDPEFTKFVCYESLSGFPV